VKFLSSQTIIKIRQIIEKARTYLFTYRKGGVVKFKKIRRIFYRTLWEEAASNIGAQLEDTGYGFLMIKKGNLETFVRLSEAALDDKMTLDVAGTKPLIHKILSERGYPVPKYVEYDISTIDKAYTFLKNLDKPAVVKPTFGTGNGRGVTTGIVDLKDLKKASYRAFAYDKSLMTEEYITGASYRLIYLGGKFIDAVRRDPPSVTGDGSSTIKELIKIENHKRLFSDPIISLSPITLDAECSNKLRQQGLTINTVLAKDRRVEIKDVVNENSMHDNHIVRDMVNPAIIKLGEEIFSSTIQINLAGLDIITTDITVPLEESGGVINEINTTPGLHHHVLVNEQDQRIPVGEMVLDYIFSKKADYNGKS